MNSGVEFDTGEDFKAKFADILSDAKERKYFLNDYHSLILGTVFKRLSQELNEKRFLFSGIEVPVA